MKEFHCKDKHCNFVLCRTDGESMFFQINGNNAVISVKEFPFPCPKCNQKSLWRREKRRNRENS